MFESHPSLIDKSALLLFLPSENLLCCSLRGEGVWFILDPLETHKVGEVSTVLPFNLLHSIDILGEILVNELLLGDLPVSLRETSYIEATLWTSFSVKAAALNRSTIHKQPLLCNRLRPKSTSKSVSCELGFPN